jgi:putative FmdB family regulatory protein
MPEYDYLCPDCGPFSAIRPMVEFNLPQPCEGCGRPAPRAMLTAPALSAMDAGRRNAFATNERSANSPTRAKAHPSGCGCCSTGGKLKAEGVGAKSFPGQRPWMISH